MYTISRFSQLCKLSPRILRHYDKEELLKPIHVEKTNGYRYYEKSQLETAFLIKKLREYGFSLPEIRTILQTSDKELFIEFIRSKINELSYEVNRHIKIITEMQEMVEKKADSLREERRLYDIFLGIRNEMEVISLRLQMNIVDMDKHIDSLYEKAEENNIQLFGAPTAIFYDEEYTPNHSDIELMIPHAHSEYLSREWYIKKLPTQLVAITLHFGSYDHIGYGHMALEEWIEGNGYFPDGPPHETYLKGPECDCPIEDYVTQICIPVIKKIRQ
ncbi:MerR family transcriptional regulator [Shimazuella kribbensis]|uniref:MerR family transcriptional regulator n=1 Tax=Shimazuella kribbensis TaxID=139808 RepID=UPI00040E993B|nr:MerR family transcriptional regulator [Shimazuella kribbensis]